MKNKIHASNNAALFRFHTHSRALQRRAANWFAEQAATLRPSRRVLALHHVLFNETTSPLRAACAVEFSISFQRTLRVPDDGKAYPLPAGLGRLPFRSVRQLRSTAVPQSWRDAATGIVPLHPAEACWLDFDAQRPFAVQIAAGAICAASGLPHQPRLIRDPQNYLSVPLQPWLDGFRVDPSNVRQFVAMPLGHGYTVESQVTGSENRGGLQVRVVPLSIEVLWTQHVLPECKRIWKKLMSPRRSRDSMRLEERGLSIEACCGSMDTMGFGAGGRITQEIYEDRIPAEHWDEPSALSCEVQLVPAASWPELTGERVPTEPPTSAQYARAGIPWFDYETAAKPLSTASPLATVKGVNQLFHAKSGLPIPDNQSIQVGDTRVLSDASGKPL